MGISFATALAANFQGQQLVADLDAKKAETANQQAMTQLHQAQGVEIQRKVEGEKQMGAWLASQQAANTQAFDDASNAAQTYSKGAQVAAASGQFDMMKQMQTMANSEMERAKDARVEVEKKAATAKEASAQTAITYMNAPTPENAVAMAKAYTAAGGNPVNIPQPGSMEFNAFAQNLTTSAMSSKDQLARVEKQHEFDATLKERQENHQEQVALRQQMLAQQAQNQQAMRAYQNESLELRKLMYGDTAERKTGQVEAAKEKVQFQQTTKLNDQLTREAKPYLADRSMTQAIKGWLTEDSPDADQQIKQALTSLKQGISRATNLYYKDNKNVGDVAQKIEGFVSGTFTGELPRDRKKRIFELVDGMERQVIDPALRNLENDAKSKAKLYKIPEEGVKLGQDFNRTIAPKKETSKTGNSSVTGGIDETQGSLKPTAPVAPALNLPSGWTIK